MNGIGSMDHPYRKKYKVGSLSHTKYKNKFQMD